ncbi:MAG: galactose mutarotase [Clostridia bacterium]|nr:galactose mutarotase [Clostridia bacterium]
MKETVFGTLPNGKQVHIYTLRNEALTLRVLDYGCRIQSLIFDGRDMICGYDSLDAYLADDSWQGAFVGRVANRIRGARFDLNGKTYRLNPNEKGNHLHGSFGISLWEVKEAGENFITFFRKSPATEEGYPGDMEIAVTYSLDGNSLKMRYYATADADTPASFTNHSYFNIDGIGSGSILSHEMKLYADRITLVDADLLPTGKHMDVAGTAYDFAEFRPIGSRISAEVDGYDTNFFLTKNAPCETNGRMVYAAASVRSESYQMDCYTDMPCIQVYTGNFLGSGPNFKYGVAQAKQHALCLETQFEPDCVNRGEHILRTGEAYDHLTVYTFRHR